MMMTLSFLGTTSRRLRQIMSMFVAMSSCLLFVLQPTTATTPATAKMMSQLAWQFRSATPKDVAFARKTMIQQAMNPLSISKERLLVAFDDEEESTKLTEDATTAPNGMLGFGQIRPLDDLYSELASLYVLPKKRRKGIGGALVQELLSRHDAKQQDNNGGQRKTNVVLLTLRPTTPLYEKYGFEIVDDASEIPSSLQFEYKAGSIVSTFLGNDLVCMKRVERLKSK